MKKIVLSIFILFSTIVTFSIVDTSISPVLPAYAITWKNGDSDLGKTTDPLAVKARAPFFPGQSEYSNLGDYISGFYTFSIWLVTIISVIMIIWGGYLIITSSGNPESVKKGREIVFSALVSLGILIMATVILGIINPQIIKNPWVPALPDYGRSGDTIQENTGDGGGTDNNGGINGGGGTDDGDGINGGGGGQPAEIPPEHPTN